jgi:hypothetical protein
MVRGFTFGLIIFEWGFVPHGAVFHESGTQPKNLGVWENVVFGLCWARRARSEKFKGFEEMSRVLCGARRARSKKFRGLENIVLVLCRAQRARSENFRGF